MSYPLMFSNFWTASLTGSVRVYQQPGKPVTMPNCSVRSDAWGMVGTTPASLTVTGDTCVLVCTGFYEPAVGARVAGQLTVTCTGTTQSDPGSVRFVFAPDGGGTSIDTGVQKLTNGSVVIQS